MKYKEFIEVKTLVKKGKVEARQIGTIISILENPEGYIVEFCHLINNICIQGMHY